LGKIIAWRRGGWLESGITLVGVASYTSFAPFLGFVLIFIFGYSLKWLPYHHMIDHNIWYKASVSLEWVLTRMVITGLLLLIGHGLLGWVAKQVILRRQRVVVRVVGSLLIWTSAWLWWHQSGHGKLAFDALKHMILPLGTVVLLSFGETMLLMRTTMLETIGDEYILMARAKGLPEKTIRDRHVARNAFLPVITRLLLNLPFVLTGSLAVELVFQWQAMGELIFLAVDYQDIPLLMGILSIVGALALVGHVLLDIIHVYIDPRLRYAERY
jgi:peptide/nickel transport system permease protein